MRKAISIVLCLMFVLCGCRAIVAGLTTATNETAVVAEDMKESANPYVSLAGWLAALTATGAMGVLAKIRKKHNLEEREMNEQERALFKSVALVLANAIEATRATEVKNAVASATKHNPELEHVVKGVLADVTPVPSA